MGAATIEFQRQVVLPTSLLFFGDFLAAGSKPYSRVLNARESEPCGEMPSELFTSRAMQPDRRRDVLTVERRTYTDFSLLRA